MSVADVILNISNIKTIEDCPYSRVAMQDDGRPGSDEGALRFGELLLVVSNYTLTPFIAPFGRCCEVVKPKIAETNTISSFAVKGSSPEVEYKVFIVDQTSASSFMKEKFHIIGETLKTGIGRRFISMKLKIIKKYLSISLFSFLILLKLFSFEGNPSLKCRDYTNEANGYGKVI